MCDLKVKAQEQKGTAATMCPDIGFRCSCRLKNYVQGYTDLPRRRHAIARPIPIKNRCEPARDASLFETTFKGRLHILGHPPSVASSKRGTAKLARGKSRLSETNYLDFAIQLWMPIAVGMHSAKLKNTQYIFPCSVFDALGHDRKGQSQDASIHHSTT